MYWCWYQHFYEGRLKLEQLDQFTAREKSGKTKKNQKLKLKTQFIEIIYNVGNALHESHHSSIALFAARLPLVIDNLLTSFS